MTNDDPLAEAIRLIQAGNKNAARAILEPFLRQNLNHIQAWIWEAELYEDDRDKIKILEACLKVNPGERQISQALAFLKRRVEPASPPAAPTFSYSPPPSISYFPPEEEESPAPVAQELYMEAAPAEGRARGGEVESQPASAEKRPARKKNSGWMKVVGAAVAAVFVCALVGGYVGNGYSLNGQINRAFAAENCDGVAQQSSFVSLYPRGIFSSLFNGYEQYSQCSLFLAFEREGAAKNWESAIFYVQQYVASYPGGTFAARLSEQAPGLLSAWAQELIANGSYATGIEKWTQLAASYPNSAPAQSAPDAILQAYLAWAKEALDNRNYADAERRLQTALSHFESDAARAGQIKQELTALYIAWGDAQVQMGDIENGIERYRMAGELSPGAVDVDLLVARVYLQQALKYAERQEFDRAIAKVQEVIDSAQSDAIRAEAEAALEKILAAYAASVSQQAKDRMTAAIAQACQGQRPDLPSIFARAGAPVRFGTPFYGLVLPAGLAAETPGELHYVLCVAEEQETIQACAYEGGRTLYRIRLVWNVTLVHILTGEERASQSFPGSAPEACQPVERFPRGADTVQKFGLRPGMDQVIAWLAGLNLTQ